MTLSAMIRAPLPLLLACAPPSGPPTEVDLSSLSLRWILDDQLSAEEVRVGLDWNLGLLSALPPAGGEHLEITEDGEQLRILLHVEQAGFPERAEAALTDALQELRESEELAQTGAVDLGRLFMLTLHEPWRYYSISGACADYWGWSGARLPQARDRYDVVVSLIAPGERVVLLPEAEHPVQRLAFGMATGQSALGEDWRPAEFETIDLMENGQQRFATYDGQGRLQPWADPEVVAAGQPGRCIWCHEGNLMFGTYENPSSEEAISYPEWEARIFAWQDQLEAWRAALPTSIVYPDRHSHTLAERVVRDFAFPTPKRAAREWGLSEEEALRIVAERGLLLEEDSEWPDRGEVLRRAEVDALLEELSGTPRLSVLSDPRLPVEGEPLRGEQWAGWLRCEPLGGAD